MCDKKWPSVKNDKKDVYVGCSILTQEVRYISAVSIATIDSIKSILAQCTCRKGPTQLLEVTIKDDISSCLWWVTINQFDVHVKRLSKQEGHYFTVTEQCVAKKDSYRPAVKQHVCIKSKLRTITRKKKTVLFYWQ